MSAILESLILNHSGLPSILRLHGDNKKLFRDYLMSRGINTFNVVKNNFNFFKINTLNESMGYNFLSHDTYGRYLDRLKTMIPCKMTATPDPSYNFSMHENFYFFSSYYFLENQVMKMLGQGDWGILKEIITLLDSSYDDWLIKVQPLLDEYSIDVSRNWFESHPIRSHDVWELLESIKL